VCFLKKICLMIISILILSFTSTPVSAAPVSGISELSGEINSEKPDLFKFNIALRYDHQKNKLPKQIDQFLYKNPDAEDEEDPRHHSRTRSSENFTDITEAEFGVVLFDSTYIYAKAGTGRFSSTLSLLDQSVKGIYTGPDSYTVTDNSIFIYGGGLAFNTYKKNVDKIFKNIYGHLDVQYRRHSINSNNGGRDNIKYEAEIDEIQASFLLIGSFEHAKVFFGPRISNYTGDEKFSIGRTYFSETGFSYNEKLETSRNRGFVFGISLFENEKYSVTMQKRTGDEKGVSFEAQFSF
ncbi:MAG: hypothetical protein ACQESP_13565, partial [Candidatus Muiribacteriota bacterium]